MTFSFSLVLGLVLLAPGLAVFAGIYHAGRLGLVKSPPPPPGSILALAIVACGTLGAHLVGATVFWVQDLVCAHLRACLTVTDEPNVYAILFGAALLNRTLTGFQAVALLATLVALTAAAFLAARALVARLGSGSGAKAFLYGWLADVDVASRPGEAVLAYVLSDIEADGTVVGYEGAVANLTTNADKEITSILLMDCETFYLRVTAAGVVRRKAARPSDFAQIYLDRSRIKNIAFELVRFADDE